VPVSPVLRQQYCADAVVPERPYWLRTCFALPPLLTPTIAIGVYPESATLIEIPPQLYNAPGIYAAPENVFVTKRLFKVFLRT